jgi:arsenite methyltransferase
MKTDEQLKEIVRQKYSEIALQDKETNMSSCCGAGGCSTEVYNIMSDDYTNLKGYNADADLGLGCGLPTQFAKIKKGDVVVDLGSGAGIDFTSAMIDRARANAEARGFNNVEFRQGDIEQMPITSNVADVIVSNCVLNLVPNKDGVFKEIFRVLKPGGHFSISDVVLLGALPEGLRKDAEMYAGCVAGAIQRDVYLELIQANGFENITIQKEKPIVIPDDILINYLSAEQIELLKSGNTGIFSITVFAQKPLTEKQSCCTPGSGCC